MLFGKYQKTINVGILSNGTKEYKIPHGISDVKKFWDLDWCAECVEDDTYKYRAGYVGIDKKYIYIVPNIKEDKKYKWLVTVEYDKNET